MKIINLKDLKNQNLMVAFIKGNRDVSEKNRKSKEDSLLRFNGNIIPMMYVSGTKAVADECELVDYDGNYIPTTDADKYIVIIDGQHRYTAFLRIQDKSSITEENITLFEAYSDKSTKELLSEANIASIGWNGSDYAKSTVILNPDNEIAKAVAQLQNYGINNVSTISKILCWNNGKITKAVLAKISKGINVDIDINLERAKQFYEAASAQFTNRFISKRYLIDAVIDLSSKGGYEEICEKIKKIGRAKADALERVKVNVEEEIKLVLKK
jgi:hypothetical protein